MGIDQFNELNRRNSTKVTNTDATGIAFGTAFSIKVSTSEKRVIYGNANVYAGSLFNFIHETNVMCKDWGTKEFGINNWYGHAQAFAGISANLRARIKFFGINKDINLAKAELGTILAADFPNPSWFYGKVEGEAQVLNFKKVGFSLDVEIGDKCNPVEIAQEESVEISNGDIIKSTFPVSNKSAPAIISTYAQPNITFNYDFEKNIYTSDEDGNSYYYKFCVEDIEVVDANELLVNNIPVKKQWENERILHLKPENGLWPNASTIGLRLYFTLKESTDGVNWKVTPNNGTGLTDFDATKSETYLLSTIIWFQTKSVQEDVKEEALLLANVMDSYPVVDQKYFLVSQLSKGHIEIDNQTYLFETDGTPKNNITVAFIKGEKPFGNPIVATYSNKIIEYDLPSLETKSSYTIEIRVGESAVLSYQFGTSKYPTFARKAEDIKSIISEENAQVKYITATCEYGEPFDEVELFGNNYNKNKALVTAYALINNNSNTYYNKVVEWMKSKDPEMAPDISNEKVLPEKIGFDFFEHAMISQSIFPFIYNIDYKTTVFAEVLKNIDNTGFPELIDEKLPVRLAYYYGNESDNNSSVDFKYNKSTLKHEKN
jgi:hypothetical protein